MGPCSDDMPLYLPLCRAWTVRSFQVGVTVAGGVNVLWCRGTGPAEPETDIHLADDIRSPEHPSRLNKHVLYPSRGPGT